MNERASERMRESERDQMLWHVHSDRDHTTRAHTHARAIKMKFKRSSEGIDVIRTQHQLDSGKNIIEFIMLLYILTNKL